MGFIVAGIAIASSVATSTWPGVRTVAFAFVLVGVASAVFAVTGAVNDSVFRPHVADVVLLALLVLCAPFLLGVRNADRASSELADRVDTRLVLDGAARHARAQRVEIDLELRPGKLWLSIRDDGQGFDPSGPHAGQGLRNLQRRASALGGNLALESAPGKGTTVRIRLHASRFQIIPPSNGAGERHLPREQTVRVLLVDDDPRLIAVLTDIIEFEGHAVTAASNGEEALELFEPGVHDLVITDLGMPRMTGWEVAERIKARSASTPVYLITGWGEGVSAHASSQFVDRVIAKPVSAESLLEQLAELKRSGVASA